MILFISFILFAVFLLGGIVLVAFKSTASLGLGIVIVMALLAPLYVWVVGVLQSRG